MISYEGVWADVDMCLCDLFQMLLAQLVRKKNIDSHIKIPQNREVCVSLQKLLPYFYKFLTSDAYSF